MEFSLNEKVVQLNLVSWAQQPEAFWHCADCLCFFPLTSTDRQANNHYIYVNTCLFCLLSPWYRPFPFFLLISTGIFQSCHLLILTGNVGINTTWLIQDDVASANEQSPAHTVWIPESTEPIYATVVKNFPSKILQRNLDVL